MRRSVDVGDIVKINWKVVIAVMIAIFIIPQCFVIISPGHRGIVVQLGAVQNKVLPEGIHFRIPFIQWIVPMEVRIKKRETSADAASRDLQRTYSTIALNYHILPEMSNRVYQTIGKEYEARIIDPAVQEVVKAVTAKFTAIELITQRENVKDEIKDFLTARLRTYNIIVDDFSIVDFQFSQEFTSAIEAKQVAEQQAFKAQRDLERIKIEAEQKITQAKAEAEALRLQKEQVTSQLVQLRQIEAQIKAIEKWNGILPQVTSDSVPFIGVGGK
ncbi:TPA: HflC protein [bacterium]|nr:HflC protein [bacterium]